MRTNVFVYLIVGETYFSFIFLLTDFISSVNFTSHNFAWFIFHSFGCIFLKIYKKLSIYLG